MSDRLAPPNPQELRTGSNQLEAIATEIGSHYFGPSEFIEDFTVAAAARGHVLLEATPGTSKTVLAKGLGEIFCADYKRIQGTSDLMPSDITGGRVYNMKTGEFEFMKGPIFAELVLVDEANRMNGKARSALIEAMAEGHVTVFGVEYALPEGHKVIATENPFDRSTDRLDDATKDRFRYGLYMPTPVTEDKRKAHEREDDDPRFNEIIDQHELRQLRSLADRVGITPEAQNRILTIEQTIGSLAVGEDTALITEQSAKLIWNSARAGRFLRRLAQMDAVLRGSGRVDPTSIDRLANVVYAHRIQPTLHAREDEKLNPVEIVQVAVEKAQKGSEAITRVR